MTLQKRPRTVTVRDPQAVLQAPLQRIAEARAVQVPAREAVAQLHLLVRAPEQLDAALAMARRAGLKIGIISGRSSAALTKRAEELKVDFFYHGLNPKKTAAIRMAWSRSGAARASASASTSPRSKSPRWPCTCAAIFV